MRTWMKTARRMRAQARAGFTLIEIIVVLVILMILFGLLFVPLYQTFSATKRAETISLVQDQLSVAMAQIVQDLEEAMYVYPPPDAAMYSSVDVPDAVFLPFLDVRRPATEDEVVIGYFDESGTWVEVPGNPDKLAYPARPSARIVRYFVAPLPGHPAGAYMWGEDPAVDPLFRGLIGYMNPMVSAYGDAATQNLAALYRADWSLAEVEVAAGVPPGTLSLANVSTPYFYTGYLYDPVTGALVSPPAGPTALGQYWRLASTALTDRQMMDCALYRYDPGIDDETPVMFAPPTGLPGALPGFSLSPKVVPNEVVEPSASREATGYRSREQFWSNLDLGADPTWPWPVAPIMHINEASPMFPLPVADYTAAAAASWTVPTAGDTGTRLLPKLNPVTGELRFARRWTDVYYETAPGVPGTPPANVGFLQRDATPATYPHLYRVGYGLFRGDPPGYTTPLPPFPPAPAARTASATFNERDPRFKIVNESEVVQIRHIATGQVVQCQRVQGEPKGPFQYRIDYLTGVIRFDKLNYPDPTAFEIWIEYEYRDNFSWSPVDPRGYVDDTLMVTYVSRREMTVGLNLAGFDLSTGEAIPMSASRLIRLRNTVQ